ncbi:protease inhibitor I42 family protein [Nocardia alni]|uniref:protease inhibitor I42 family protein n=1 Tax=Nocardia alni TaxID=2815723 RepID=UPI001C239EB1|nr:protease inhibitor I42 family protein [Nocardia alni]
MVVFGLALVAGGANVVAVDAAAAPVAAPVDEPVIVGTDANGQSRSLSVGQELAVALPDAPSTGYVWRISALNRGVLHQEGDPQFRSENPLPGSAGTSVWTFTAAAPGRTTLTLASVRAGVAPARTFSEDITVK